MKREKRRVSYVVFTVKDIVYMIIGCMLNEFDFPLVVEGKRGIGKSTLVWKICRRIPGFQPRKSMVYSREDLIKAIATWHYSAIFPDELINAGHNRDFFASEQNLLIKLINMYRDSCNLIAGAVPYFVDLDPQLRKLIKMRIQVIERGFAVVHLQIEGSFSKDPWLLKECEKIERTWKPGKPKYMQLPTAIGFLKFGDLSAKERDLYKQIKREKRNKLYAFGEDLGPESGEGDPRVKIYEELKAGKLTQEHLRFSARMFSINYESLRKFLNDLLKKDKDPKFNGKLLNDLLFKPEKEQLKKKFKLI